MHQNDLSRLEIALRIGGDDFLFDDYDGRDVERCG